MTSSVVFCLLVGFAIFEFGTSLQCYSCPDGSSSDCSVTQTCDGRDDSCLKLISGENTYTSCVRYADCDFRTMAARYRRIPKFTFSCCQAELCNGPEKSWSDKLKDLFGFKSKNDNDGADAQRD